MTDRVAAAAWPCHCGLPAQQPLRDGNHDGP